MSRILVGRHLVGILGLKKAFEAVAEAQLTDREAIVDVLLEHLVQDNYVPDSRLEEHRRALWREYLRAQGEDIRDLYTELEVVIRGEPGPIRDGFTDKTIEVLQAFELKAVVHYEPPPADGRVPQLVIDGDVVLAGDKSPKVMKRTLRKRITEW